MTLTTEELNLKSHPRALEIATQLVNSAPSSPGHSPYFLWNEEGTDRVIQGFGQVLEFAAPSPQEALSAIQLAKLPKGVRAWGGIAFDPDRPSSPEWAPFGPVRFWVPEWELTRENGILLGLRRNSYAGARPNPDSRSANLKKSGRANSGDIPFGECPNQEGWKEMVDGALADPTLIKTVLARRVRIPGPTHSAPLKMNRTGCTTFEFSPQPEFRFFGATPERLCKIEGRDLTTMALAGTRPRHSERLEDVRVFSSPKDLREHDVVVQYLEENLGPYLEAPLKCLPKQIHTTDQVIHLQTLATGKLRPGVSASEVIPAIHPTPALLGRPSVAARAFIRKNEPFDRGWYGGAVGWISASDLDLWVGIRCTLSAYDQTFLYSGAGIVEGSVPEKEWEELNWKTASMKEWIEGGARP